MPVDEDNITPRARALAAALRRLRNDSRVSSRELCARLGRSHSVVSHWETGRRLPTPEDVARLLDALAVAGDERERTLDMARRANEPNWLTVGLPGLPVQTAMVAECERAASEIINWEPFLVPGLLQTAEYARAMFTADRLAVREIESRLTARMVRRDVIARSSYPARLAVLIGEAALREPIASPVVMAEQLRFLVEFADRPNVDLQVVPSGLGWHPGLLGPFVLYQFPETSPTLYLEQYGAGAFVSADADVAAYLVAIERLRQIAIGGQDSSRLIAKIAGEWED